MMMKLEVSINLPATPEEVWRYLSDLSHFAEWANADDEITFTSDVTEGVGTTFQVKLSLGVLKFTDNVTITEWQPPPEADAVSGAGGDGDGVSGAGGDGDAVSGAGAEAVSDAVEINAGAIAVIAVTHEGAVQGEGRYTLTAGPSGDTVFTCTEHLHMLWRVGGLLLAPVSARFLRRLVLRNLRQLRVQIMELNEAVAPDEPGALIGRGLDTEVRRYGDHAVRISLRDADLSHEADAMAYVGEHGFPAPKLISRPDPTSIVMERLSGPTMLEDITAKPWLMPRHAKALAELHHRLGAIEAPPDWTQVSAGSKVCHLSMHPDNVKVTRNGLVVIDWSNAARGDAAFDAALTYVSLRTAPHIAGVVARTMVAGFRHRFAQAFLKAFGVDDIMAHLRSAAELRLLDPSLNSTERESVFALARGEQE